jgi:replicative DNA helicase Mcm
MVNGVVVKSTVVKPKVLKAAFECRRCGNRQFIEQTQHFLKVPVVCTSPSCQAKGPFEYVEEESEYANMQELWVQENPEQLPPGQLPRSLHLKITGEIVDTARPGDNVSVVGIVRSLPKKVKGGQLSVFDLFVEANSIKVLGKEPEAIPDISEINRIMELGKDPWIHRKILQSIAPSIYGYENLKEAITYLLFGGVPKELEDIRIRGEINVLLVGDPGTAKSQLLRYVARLAPRGLYTSGKGTTGVGLTAAVLKEKESGEYSLEAGALVLADKGVACIDEIDKMNPDDRATIHEVLEQHTVSIAKGGIVATLNARTAVLAAANPSLGRYNAYTTIIENISLPVTLLSRFDLIFLMRDVPEATQDAKLSKHILSIHAGAATNAPIPPTLLRKYITYARQLQPKLTPEAIARIQEFYLKMRKASGDAEGSPIIVGPRQLEGLARLSEARARAALREQVTQEDAEAAIRIMMKSLEEVGIDVTSGKMDIDILMTGKPKSTRDKLSVVIKVIIELSKDTGIIEQELVKEELEKTYGITKQDAEKLIQQLLRDGTLFQPREGFLKKT